MLWRYTGNVTHNSNEDKALTKTYMSSKIQFVENSGGIFEDKQQK